MSTMVGGHRGSTTPACPRYSSLHLCNASQRKRDSEAVVQSQDYLTDKTTDDGQLRKCARYTMSPQPKLHLMIVPIVHGRAGTRELTSHDTNNCTTPSWLTVVGRLVTAMPIIHLQLKLFLLQGYDLTRKVCVYCSLSSNKEG